MDIDYHVATDSDSPLLAKMNLRLIRDEGHRNPMTLAELERRMEGWLCAEYRAVLFEYQGVPCGYALYRQEPDHVYLRQFYVDPMFRRQGVGRQALNWLMANEWQDQQRIRLDVLTGNHTGLSFWEAMGFSSYCITLERETPPATSDCDETA